MATFGEPTNKGEVIEWEATGDRVSEWVWDDRGLQLDMAETDSGFTVLSISISAPCQETTSRGVGIGTSFDEVDRIYGEFRGVGRNEDEEEPEQWDSNQIIVGSIYGGTFFDFADGRVVRIFVGAGAE
jgi:hypothetical protein